MTPWVGIGSVLIVVALLGLPIGVLGLVRGRSRALRLRGRRAAGAVLGASVLTLIVGTATVAATQPAAAPPPVAPPVAASASTASVPVAAPDAAPVAVASTRPVASRRPTAAPTGVPGSALAVLDSLPVKGRAPMTGYARVAEFGTAWLDVDRNGCDTRNDILRRDLADTTGSGCRVLRGVLDDPYTGRVVDFVRGEGTSTAVQIDHVVSLGDAWQTGAQRLSQAKRIDLANDPINLFAVDGPTNERKGDGDTATWLPPNKAFRCTYVAHQVGVKKAYGLWVAPAEKAAMQRILTTCPTARAPVSSVSDVVLPVAAPRVHRSTAAAPSSAPKPPARADAGVVHPGAFCSPQGATGHTAKGTPMTCRTSATDTRDRWRSSL
ncbi:HNH endonuclease family protein [Amnibacterium sp.]|uniref:HNH endonuclease family protein n=1 Tax=Amnibacterium sp. TaxID=1872496 RepID=UPI002619B972|nr:HNH endonuclease family protein [Amnibacterium sp.]MCU1472250.1 hypothetical protein [Amnibacterium sp.]